MQGLLGSISSALASHAESVRAVTSGAPVPPLGEANASSYATTDTAPPSAAFVPIVSQTTPVSTPLSFLLLTQNLGGINCADVDGSDNVTTVSPRVQRHTTRFVKSLRHFISEACKAHAAHICREESKVRGTAVDRPGPRRTTPVNAVGDSTPRNSVELPPLIDVITIQFQEIGGKQRCPAFNEYLNGLLSRTLLPEAGWCSGLLMHSGKGSDNFTALGTLIFLSRRMCPISSILSFRQRSFIAIEDDPVTYAQDLTESVRPSMPATAATACASPEQQQWHPPSSGDTERHSSPPTKGTAPGSTLWAKLSVPQQPSVGTRTQAQTEFDYSTPLAGSALFHGGKFSNAMGSRKGYLLTTMRLGTVVVHFINIHLFHDVDNRDAAKQSPSEYAIRRQEALLEALAEAGPFITPADPIFIIGDFNTRLEASSLLTHLREERRIDVTLGKRLIRAPDDFWNLFTHADESSLMFLRKFDREPMQLMDVLARQSGLELAEMPIRFPPSYIRVSDTSSPTNMTGPEFSQVDDDQSMVEQNVRDTVNPIAEVGVSSEPERAGREGSGQLQVEIAAEDELSVTRSSNAVASTAPQGDGKAATITPSLTETKDEFASLEPLLQRRRTREYDRCRLPAWCDRIMFNPAALKLMSCSGGIHHGEPVMAVTAAGHLYSYESVPLLSTDHDGVFLLF